ncbi:kinase-like domain-containing protein [Rhizophagus irregularis DAOM 181602=DAOM 197198]|nr:kinase-like domain-containing protein [Rhizophagus irregularis DAOM 181602=DAOM 197198]
MKMIHSRKKHGKIKHGSDFLQGLVVSLRRSGNAILDEFIFKKDLKWISYNQFINVEYLNQGGFGIIYKAIWLNDYKDEEVILKCHDKLNENLNEFLHEWKYHERCLDSNNIINFYKFTKNPDNLKYMVVMDYANKGNLRENLARIIKNNWKQKLYMLYEIISGLNEIHQQDLIHCDFHDGNILSHNDRNEDKIYISDLGLCQPAKSFLKEIPPFNNRAHDIQLSLSICKGERPEIIENTPQCYVDLMKKCWNEDPLKRPSSEKVLDIIKKWIYLPYEMKFEDIDENLKCSVMEFINTPIKHNTLVTESHSQACYTSRLLDFSSKNLNEILENEDLQASMKVNEMLVSEDLNNCIIKI